ncbi:restriction endonuclease subunit S [Tenacibaculum bernardetii]|uniref:restriction endonuclease subunit S n=1 Tax=Tenacibaculum bernardetii TaxID=3021375 RepID=UPI0023B141F0|nr:restriction endonuclease subunit S [Tenacibaculum bernardetii]
MKQYETYKDSGVEWLGEIPEHWEVKRLKFLGDAIGGVTYSPKDIVENEEEGTLVLRSSNIQKGELYLEDNVYINTEIQEKKTLRNGDILICSRNGSRHLIGKNICIDERTEGETFGAFMMIFRSKNSKFLYQFFNSPIFKSQSGLFLTATINQLTSGTLNNFYIAIPKSLEEQTQIANYLNQKTAQLDTLIAKKEQLINLLQEERTAMINHAVTKGLDPNVPMKDSGIEWLGEIPAHWEVKKLKYVCQLVSDKTKEKPDYVLALENITSWSEEIIGNPFENKMEGDSNLFQENDILFNKLRPYLAKVVKATRNGGCVGELLVLRPEKKICPNFLYRRLSSEMIITIVDGSTYGTKMPRASWDKFISNIQIGVPPREEQEQISDYIETKLNYSKSIVEKYQKEIELLKEYKTALISEVVTGKVDVREEVLN